MRRLSPPLEIQEVEGDAVFALAASPAISSHSTLLEFLEGAVAAFRRSQRAMEADQSCQCEACHGVAGLDLKIVAHHGRFVHLGDVRCYVRELGRPPALPFRPWPRPRPTPAAA